MAQRNAVKHNWRLLRIAESICSCLLTDGFCGPEHRPDCRCWIAARAALQGLRNQSDPCLEDAWPTMPKEGRRPRMEALCDAIGLKQDDLTEQAQRCKSTT